jgi:hypothetical protein
MRFLQTEWHRHERDRNAWEIERQEMRVRIAALEGSGRRSDVQQKGLRKYVKMLETALAAERKKSKASNGIAEGKEDEAEPPKLKPHPRREWDSGWFLVSDVLIFDSYTSEISTYFISGCQGRGTREGRGTG